MIPVDQEFVHNPEAGINGDCKRAVVASLLELPISEVPHFLEGLPMDSEGYLEFDRRVQRFLSKHGLFEMEIKGCIDLMRWIQRRHGGSDVYHEIYGPSPRDPKNLLHAVVGCNGVIVHDPHPTKAGLAGDPSEWGHVFLLANNIGRARK